MLTLDKEFANRSLLCLLRLCSFCRSGSPSADLPSWCVEGARSPVGALRAAHVSSAPLPDLISPSDDCGGEISSAAAPVLSMDLRAAHRPMPHIEGLTDSDRQGHIRNRDNDIRRHRDARKNTAAVYLAIESSQRDTICTADGGSPPAHKVGGLPDVVPARHGPGLVHTRARRRARMHESI